MNRRRDKKVVTNFNEDQEVYVFVVLAGILFINTKEWVLLSLKPDPPVLSAHPL
jgi:hypothetical protein